MTLTPWLLFAMLPAAALIMLHLAVGPFGHPSLLHWHVKWKEKSDILKKPLLFLAVFTLISGATLLLGLWEIPTEA